MISKRSVKHPPARPNAEINMVVKWNLFVPVELVNPAFLHNSPPFCSLRKPIRCFKYNRSTFCTQVIILTYH